MLTWTPEEYGKCLLFIRLKFESPDWPDLRVAPFPSPRHRALSLSWLSPPLLQFFETVWFSLIFFFFCWQWQAQLTLWGFCCLFLKAFCTWTFWEVFLLLLLRLCTCLLNQIPVLLCSGVGCNFCWSWLGSPINSCRSEVFCVLGNIACDSEVVQMLFIYADILWVLRFMFQCETEDILRVVIACLASCLFWEIRF